MAKMSFVISDQTFINPYNFVGVNWERTAREEVSKGDLTGVLHCELRAKTPLAIPEFIKKENDHSYYGFMRDAEGKIMIPGSSIRGPIRSVYETVTESCFSTNKEEQIITKRAAMRESGQAGVLKRDDDGNWKLYEAKRYLIVINDSRYKSFNRPEFDSAKRYTRKELYEIGEGTIVYFDAIGLYSSQKDGRTTPVGKVIKDISTANSGQPHKGYLCIGEVPPLDDNGRPQTNKHFESVFELTGKELSDSISKNMISRIEYLLEMYNDTSVNRNATDDKKAIYRGVSKSIENGIIPIWYRPRGKNFVFSIAAIGRISFETYLDDLLGAKKKCTDRKSACEACRLFGMASEEGIGGRIRITDAKLSSDVEPKFISEVLLKELGSPKISYIPFYAEKNNHERLDSYDDKEAALKGRKYYWHNLRKDDYKDTTSKPNKRNATMDLLDVDEKHVFSFDIYYDRVSQEELDKIKWVLTLGDNSSESNLCHKIGHGKPLGLGSVKITIKNDARRTFDLDGGYGIDDIVPCMPERFPNLYHMEEIKNICDTSTTEGKRISYPYIVDAKPNDNDTAPHKWFSKNWEPTRHLDQSFPTIKEVKEGKVLYAYRTDETESASEYYKEESRPKQQNRDKGSTHNPNNPNIEKDGVYKGTVTEYNKNGTFAIVELENGKRASFWDGDHKYDGCQVSLKYLGKREGKDGRLYDNWKLINTL